MQYPLAETIDLPRSELSQTHPPALEGPRRPRVEGYELLEELGRGGSGIVYRARQRRPDRTVALKLIRDGSIASTRERERFLAEGRIASRLEHRGIVPVHEVGESQGEHYYTMALVQGGSLADRLCEGPFEPREAAELCTDLASAVSYAHGRGVVHRDLKPENVLYDEAGNACITDFGLAVDSGSGRRLTLSGEIVGTPAYMAPEQVHGDGSVGPAADVYALGCVLYTCLTGAPPFRSATLVGTLRQIVDSVPVPPRLVNPAVPRELDAICSKCLEKSPVRRYGSARELREDLRAFLDGNPVAAQDGQTNAFLRVLLSESRHTDVLARWSRIGMVHATVSLTLSLATGALVSSGVEGAWPFAALWIPGWFLTSAVPVLLRALGGPLSRVERQLSQVWGMLAVAVALTGAVLLFRGDPPVSVVPAILAQCALGVGAMSVILGGSFYFLAIACALGAAATALAPAWAIAPIGAAIALLHFSIARSAGKLVDQDAASRAPCAQ